MLRKREVVSRYVAAGVSIDTATKDYCRHPGKKRLAVMRQALLAYSEARQAYCTLIGQKG